MRFKFCSQIYHFEPFIHLLARGLAVGCWFTCPVIETVLYLLARGLAVRCRFTRSVIETVVFTHISLTPRPSKTRRTTVNQTNIY